MCPGDAFKGMELVISTLPAPSPRKMGAARTEAPSQSNTIEIYRAVSQARGMRSVWVPFLMMAIFVAGCGQPPVGSPVAAQSPPSSPTQAQPKLSTIKLWLGPKEITAEQALTPKQVETGMMFRKELGENEGMLFVFSRPSRVAFWMRNTLIPLSCAYLDPEGRILEIHEMKPLDETTIRASSDQIQYVLEMNPQWFARNNIGTGTVVRTERGTLAETYSRR